MITVNGKEYRNLVEQVQKNKEDIAKHYDSDRVLEDYGIKIVGSVNTSDELPNPLTYDGAYGDAYTVGVEAPYDFYVFTRPLQGETDNRWLDLGQLAIEGPQGPEGPQGIQGETGTSTRWYTGNGAPYGSGYENGDMYLDNYSWNVYIYESQAFKLIGNIKGVQGPQGPQGPRGVQGIPGEAGPQGANGTPGDAVKIIGILSSASMLPEPASVGRDSAYVVEDGTGQWLYFITGVEPDLIWDRVAFENGTTVLVGGNPVQTFDADTKVDKITNSYKLYGTGIDGQPKEYNFGYVEESVPESGSVVGYTPDGGIPVINTEGQIYAVSKQYVTEEIDKLDTKFVENKDINNGGGWLTVANSVYAIGDTGENTLVGFASGYSTGTVNTLILRDANGRAQVNNPSQLADIANKRYVNNACRNLLFSTTSNRSVSVSSLITSFQTAGYQQGGRVVVTALPSTTAQATSSMGVGIQSDDAYCRYAKIEYYYGANINIGYAYGYDGTRSFITIRTNSTFYRHSQVGMLIEVYPFV